MKTAAFTSLAVASLLVVVSPQLLADADPSPASSTKFTAKPKFNSDTKPPGEITRKTSGSTGNQQVTLDTQVGMDLGVGAIAVGAKTKITSLPPEEDEWVNPASLGGFKTEITPEATAKVRMGLVEISATKTAPDKKVTLEHKFKSRENTAYWGNTVKGGIKVAEQDSQAFAPAASTGQNEPAREPYKPKTSEENLTEFERLKAEMQKVRPEAVGENQMEFERPAPAAPPAGEKLVSGVAVLKRGDRVTDEEWENIRKTVYPGEGRTVKSSATEIRVRAENITEEKWNQSAAANANMGWVYQLDPKPATSLPLTKP
jgi:hypothetical protein